MRKGTETVSGMTIQVEAILEQYPSARNSDSTLWMIYCEKMHKGITKRPLSEVILRRSEYNIPSIESIGRCRRKLQEKNPALRGTETVQDMRYELWKDYREYALYK